MFHNVGFIDRPALVICHHISGDDEASRILRRNLLRYLCLTQILVLRDTSMQVRRRFPTLQSVMDAGYLTKYELKLLLKESGEYHIYWVPINWVMLLVKKTRNNGKVVADVLYNNIASEIFKFYDHLMTLLNYDWVNLHTFLFHQLIDFVFQVPVPLVYPQVVFLTVRIYFLLCLISRQYIINDEAPNKAKIDLYIPFMTLFEFLLQMGWLKVAEAIMNPMGEDDDDLELNYIIDRNITMAMEMTDPIPCPDATEDCFTNGIPYLYPEGTKRPRALVGSAQVKVAKSEEPVNMVPRKRYANTPINNEKIPQSNRSTCEIKVDNVRLARKRPHSQIPDSSELTSNMNDTTTYDGGDDGAGMV